MIKAVLFQGEFSESEVRELADAVRRIERRRPEDVFAMTVADDEASLEEAKRKVAAVFPHCEGVEPFDPLTLPRNVEAVQILAEIKEALEAADDYDVVYKIAELVGADIRGK